jgi:hypothetical protein
MATFVQKAQASAHYRLQSNMNRVAKRISLAHLFLRNWRRVRTATKPQYVFFKAELQALLKCGEDYLKKTAYEYYGCKDAWRHLSSYNSLSAKTDGVAKTLDVAEGFALWSLVKRRRPKVVVELGAQLGASARLWKEALKAYVPEHELILCDLEDNRRLIGDDECTFLKGDAHELLPEIFASKSVDLLHNDAHPYSLIRWSVEQGLRLRIPIFVFHDVGRGNRGPFYIASAALSSEEKLIHNTNWAEYGHWERHVMAEMFDPAILHQDAITNDNIQMQIFDSLFGVGVVLLHG